MAEVEYQTIQLGVIERADGERFEVEARVWARPPERDYWLVSYVVSHDQWGQRWHTLSVPVRVAASEELLKAVVTGSAWVQMQVFVQELTAKGRPSEVIFAREGWQLL